MSVTTAELLAENERLRVALAAALEQQTATSAILRVIAGSPTDVQPALDAVVQNASRLCGAGNVSLYQVEGSLMRKVAEHGSALTALGVGETRPITRTSVSGRAIVDRTTKTEHPSVPASWLARETIVLSTVSSSSVELRA